MPEPFQRPYLDSSVYISAIKGEQAEPGRGDLSAQILKSAQGGGFPIVASTFVVTEVIKPKGGPILTAAQEAAVDKYFERSEIVWVELDMLTARKARDLAR